MTTTTNTPDTSNDESAWDLLGLANDIERGRTPHRDDVAQALRETP